jgi:uncharacterized protein with von Willebrand factor type A (vWA) domain
VSNTELHELLGDGAAAAGVVATFTTPADTSPTVLHVDRWTRRTGARLAGQWAELGVDGVTPAHDVLASDAVETLLSSAPKFAERPADEQRARWWKQLMESPECAALRARTVCSPAIAEIAAAELATQWVAYAAENASDDAGPDGETPQQSVNRIRSPKNALAGAAQAAEDAEAVSAGLGLGSGMSLDGAKLAQYTRRLRSSTNLAAIMRMAGRFIARAKMLQRQRSDLPGMEITGVELSGDLARLLPVESSLIAGAVPELELLAIARLTQRRSLSYRRILRTPVAMGPIVVSVDESGSMHGEKIAAAKGLALAMASIARAQKRPFILSAFSGDETIRTASGSAENIVEWLEEFFGGGTVLDGPLNTLPTEAWPTGYVGKRSDHIIITDDEVGLSDELLGSYQAWAKVHGVKTYGIGIGLRHTTTLARFCDGGVWALPSLDLNNAAVDVVLSLGPTHHEVRVA